MDILDLSKIANGELPLRVDWHKTTCESIPPHMHEFFEIVFFVSGKGVHEVDSECFDMNPVDVFIIPPYTTHSYRKRKDAEIINLIFDQTRMPLWQTELFSDSVNNFFKLSGEHFLPGVIHLDGTNRNKIINKLHLLARHQSETFSGKKLTCITIFLQICQLLASFKGKKHFTNSTEELIVQVVTYMENHYQEQLSINVIARKNGVSIRTLERIFRDAYQRSPLTFLNDIRLDKSTDLLHYTSLKIYEIAEKTGFSDSNYFCKLFSHKYKISPRDYRKNTKSLIYV